MSLPEIDPLPLAPLPLSQGRTAGGATRDFAADGFVDEEAVARMLADPPQARTRPPADDWSFSPSDEDFVAWRRELSGRITRPIPVPPPGVSPQDSPFQQLAAAEPQAGPAEPEIPSLGSLLEPRHSAKRAADPGKLWLAFGSALLTASMLAMFWYLFEQEPPASAPAGKPNASQGPITPPASPGR